jgi:hypothetical protein
MKKTNHKFSSDAPRRTTEDKKWQQILTKLCTKTQ